MTRAKSPWPCCDADTISSIRSSLPHRMTNFNHTVYLLHDICDADSSILRAVAAENMMWALFITGKCMPGLMGEFPVCIPQYIRASAQQFFSCAILETMMRCSESRQYSIPRTLPIVRHRLKQLTNDTLYLEYDKDLAIFFH